MPLLKPPRGTQLNRTHPLARGLGLCWLFNEGAGAEVLDLSGNGWTGILQGDSIWCAGRLGFALYYDGGGDCVQTNSSVITSAAVSVSLWFKADTLPSVRGEDGTLLIQRTVGAPYQSFRTLIRAADDKITLMIYNSSGVNSVNINSDSAIQTGIWYHVVFILDSNFDVCMYVNGVRHAGSGNSGSFYNANDVLRLGSRTGTVDDFKGGIDLVTIFNRSLSASEITLLYREPFCMFESLEIAKWILSAPSAIPLAGSTSAQSAVAGTLGTSTSSPATKRDWLNEALFNGMTKNSFELGTTLSLGWFWTRTAGCTALYRGPDMEQIDFEDILAIDSRDVEIISPAEYVQHDINTTYFYVVRRFNSCGYQEKTLAAAAKIAIGEDGELLEPQPNNVFNLRSEQTNNNKVLLNWFYCPLDQKSQPVCFNIYCDNRTGQIDFQTSLASISYQGRKFYEYHSDTLEPGQYLFAVRAEDNGGVESSSTQLAVQVKAVSFNLIEILSAGCL